MSMHHEYATTYCTTCDTAIYSDSLYCSMKCRKFDAQRSSGLSMTTINSLGVQVSGSRSSTSLYAHSNPSTSSLTSEKASKRKESRSDSFASDRPAAPRRGSSHTRPLPVKRSSYSSSAPRSVDLVTPTITPITPMKSEPQAQAFTFPILPAGGRFNYNATEEPECRRMFFFKQVQREYPSDGN